MTYCPKCENEMVHNGDSILFSENWYCPKCDKIFVLELKELSKQWFKGQFNSDRFDDIRKFALIKEAEKKVTKEQLQELGLL